MPLFKRIIPFWSRPKGVAGRLAKHIAALDKIDKLPQDWKWDKEKVAALEKVDEQLIGDIYRMHAKKAERYSRYPDMYREIAKELQKLHKYLEEMKKGKGNADMSAVNRLLHHIELIAARRIIPDEAKLEQLKQWHMHVNVVPSLTSILVRYWTVTIELAESAGSRNARDILFSRLPLIAGAIDENSLPQLIILIRENGVPFAVHLLTAMRSSLAPGILPELRKLILVAGPSKSDLISIADILNEKTISLIINMIEKSGGSGASIIKDGLPTLKPMINGPYWNSIVDSIPSMAKFVKDDVGVIPKSFYIGFADMVKDAGNSKELWDWFGTRLGLIKDLFRRLGRNNYTLRIIMQDFWNFDYAHSGIRHTHGPWNYETASTAYIRNNPLRSENDPYYFTGLYNPFPRSFSYNRHDRYAFIMVHPGYTRFDRMAWGAIQMGGNGNYPHYINNVRRLISRIRQSGELVIIFLQERMYWGHEKTWVDTTHINSSLLHITDSFTGDPQGSVYIPDAERTYKQKIEVIYSFLKDNGIKDLLFSVKWGYNIYGHEACVAQAATHFHGAGFNVWGIKGCIYPLVPPHGDEVNHAGVNLLYAEQVKVIDVPKEPEVSERAA